MNNDLAIIIPAYKDLFLEKTLISLVNQTNQNFNVYIGDDNSPADLKSICDKFKNRLNIEYTKFPNNIGAKNLVQQWIRCIDLSKQEKWIWLFSDDDIADNNCVELFYSTIEKDNSQFDVYRFNTRVINDQDKYLGESPESPFIDTSLHMAYAILMGKRGNSMPDHIFSREIYNKYGFVETDFAQAADWATSIQFSADKGICSMRGAKVNWRIGSHNISGLARKNRKATFKGHIQFLIWIIDHFSYLKEDKDSLISYDDISYATEFNLRKVIREHYKGLSLSNYLDLYKFYRKREQGRLAAILSLNKLYLKIYPKHLCRRYR